MSLNKSKILRTAEKYVLQGKIAAAIEEYRKVVEADPSDLTTINTLGDLYVRAGRIQEAIENFSRIAESYRESGFYLKAIAMLKKISKLDPTNIDTAMKLAHLYSQQGLLVEARQQYLQVADAYARAGQARKALEAYQKIADLDPTNTSVRMKLGEIYAREGLRDQAHDAFIMAGAEFMRRGDAEQALNANLKALSVNPDSRQALMAIASIYTQKGQPERAINILCDAFEKNPGDVELLTILGRTYLEAGWMDEAEKTFLSLVELDRNRYHYLLEVGRRFLQMGNLDRAAEQVDGCLEVLIAKREEDKAIDFLRRILDRDMNHIGALKRLAQIFMRIREDHNLIATLNSLAEAALRKGDEQEAVAALRELIRLEPDEPLHRQRLYNLGVHDVLGEGSEVVRATNPLDYQYAAFDEAFVVRQISEAEILAGHGQIENALTMLKEILKHTPENVLVHLKLKDIYLRANRLQEAAKQCVELARIYELRGEAARAKELLEEARQLNPLAQPDLERLSKVDGEFEVQEVTGGFDLTRYQTSPLSDQVGLITLANDLLTNRDPQATEPSFRYVDTMQEEAHTVSRALEEELEGVDFYIAQGYLDIARDTLDRLRQEHGNHPEILSRYKQIESKMTSALSTVAAAEPTAIVHAPPTSEEHPGASIDEVGAADYMADPPQRISTSELLGQADFVISEQPNTNDLINSLVSGIESSLEAIQKEPKESPEPSGIDFHEITEELRGTTGELRLEGDFDTHYTLGLAYKDIDLIDEAIERFQMAFRIAALGQDEGNYFQCCHMLGLCFKQKGMLKPAILWFQRGLKTPNRTEDEYQALRYEMGLCYEQLGELDKAIETFMEVFAIDVNYRHVGEKLRELQALKSS
jgi:tetratricopeptide (TPR) repeat protein